ncbi:hypothetical protein CROQUDRAFT_44919 [Cronartium quercuum f. sp. fusiforme G11]|uniref:Uncharacterized protein n=1 Tax=Cronartium quercuum f. sp. fusiforme G11 TaxID=708437 RepID=A0A9P6NHI9_9BASI|nr:hypothetical protein CROQUDRAFT_44919 [Cronartium quercuum f. sp. fusiforme G11]
MNCFSPSPYLLQHHQLLPTPSRPQSPCLLLSASADSLHISTSLTPVGHPTDSIHSSTKPMLRLNSNLPPSTLLPADATPTELISPSHSIRTQKALSPSSSNTHTPTSSELQLSPTKQLRTQSILGTRPPWEVPKSHQRWSSGSAISPKDAVSREAISPFSRLPHFSPFSPQPASHCPMSSPHRRTHSGLPHLPSCRSPGTGSKRVSWNPLPASSSSARFSWASAYLASSPDPINLASPAGQALSEKQIESIESLGVKFVDRASLGIASSPMLNATVASCSRSRSGSTSSYSRHGLNRNSLSSIKRRRSVKIPAPGPLPSPALKPIPVDAGRLLEILNRAAGGKGKENEHESQSESARALLIIDLRSLNAYLGSEGRLKGSINVNFPSLLIKRFRKGHQSQFQLSSFITTDAGKRFYAALEPNLSEIEICVIDDGAEGIGAVVVDALSKARGRADGLYLLSEPFADLRARPDALNWLVAGEAGQDPGVGIAQQGLRRLDPSCGPHLNLPSLDTTVNGTENTLRLSRKVKPPKLRKIETSETYLSARPSPTSASNRIPSPLGPNQQRRPGSGSSERQNQIPGRFRFPMTNLDDPSRATATSTRDDPPKPAAVPMTDDRFKISTIIPGFLFLGPEPIESTDFSALEALGVKRILNVATECDGLEGCDRAFIEKYIKIPFRDFVEEVGVQGRIEQANKLLGK